MSSGESTWYNWRVIISATQQPSFLLRLDTQGPPTVGPNGEAIDTAQSRVVDYRSDNSVKIQEMGTVTGQRYQVKHIKVIAQPNTMTTVDTSLPYDINLIAVKNVFTPEMTGDVISWLLAPNTICGVITSNVSIGDTVINVSPTVIANIDESWRFRIASSSNPAVYENLGHVVSIDHTNGTLTVDTPATQTHSAGDYVQMTAVYTESLEICNANYVLEMGLEIPRVAYIPANAAVRCEYTNNSSTAKTFYCYYSFYYGSIGAT
jgi:hypothetical protein